MKHLAILMAVFLLVGCQTTDNVPKKKSPDQPKKVVNVVKNGVEYVFKKEDEETGKPELDKPELPPMINVPKQVQCFPGEYILQGLAEESKEKPVVLWKDGYYGHQVIFFVNKETGTSTLIEYPPMFKGDYACVLSVGVETLLMGEKNSQGISVKYLTN